MAKFCICWLACCSLLLPFHTRAADMPVSAEFFLQSIEPEPGATMLYDFLDIYGTHFAECKEIETYARALDYLVANGDITTVRERLRELEACTGLAESTRQRLLALKAKTAEPAPLVAQAPESVRRAEPAPVIHSTPEIPPAPVTEPVAASVAEPVTVPVAVPAPVLEPAVPALSVPSTPSGPTEPPTAHLAASSNQSAEKAHVQAPAKARKRARVRKTSLPVTPTIPMPSRSVPSVVLGPKSALKSATGSEPSQPPQPLLPNGNAVPQGESMGTPVASAWSTELASRAVYRSGTEGTSRLLRMENTASLGYGDWTFSATAVYLNAGRAGNSEFVGSYYGGTPQHSLLTEQAAFIPQIAFDGDSVDFSLGSSPLGGEVSPLPAFRLSVTALEKLKLTVYQESVTDSLLSYTGFRDPVSGARMGRVMRSGLRAGWEDTFAEQWFYGGAMSAAYLYGENVKDNVQFRGEVYIGRSLGSLGEGTVAVGSYSAVDHYKTNLNNYTFGHGGYYSPRVAATSVLFASWEYAGTAGRIKADLSSGYLYEETRDSSLYYGAEGAPHGVYRGETHHRLTVNAGLEGSLNLTENVNLNSTLRIINSGDFTETRGALYIKWMF